MAGGWDESAAAWVASLGTDGDFGRRFVLDAPMLARVRGRGFARALDVGCGEGRFCRMLQAEGLATIGIDPTRALIAEARRRDAAGDYRVEAAEAMTFVAAFDLVVSYLSLIDIDDLDAALAAMVAALRPGGTLLIANLNPFNTAALPDGWTHGPDGERFAIDHYLDERAVWTEWRGIRIRNWHRPMQRYLQALLAAGLELRWFAEPAPHGGESAKAARYRRVPYFHIMEWRKPG